VKWSEPLRTTISWRRPTRQSADTERHLSPSLRAVRTLESGKFRQKLLVWFIKLYPLWDVATPGGLRKPRE